MKKIGVDIRDAFFEEVYRFAKKDPDLIFITDDLDAWVLKKFKKDFPRQFINIGVAEQAMVDIASGLAVCGKKVFIYGINSFITARCYEQLRFCVCSMNLPIVVVGVGTGFSFSFDGSTHHGTNDIGIMRILPEMGIFNPCDEISARKIANLVYKARVPVYVRLDKGVFPLIYSKVDEFKTGFKIIRSMGKINIISTGTLTHVACAVSDDLSKIGVKVGVIDVFRVKPIDSKLIVGVIAKSRKLLTLEENLKTGGLGSAISEIISDENLEVKLKRLCVEDRQFSVFGDRNWLLSLNKLDKTSVKRSILNFLK